MVIVECALALNDSIELISVSRGILQDEPSIFQYQDIENNETVSSKLPEMKRALVGSLVVYG